MNESSETVYRSLPPVNDLMQHADVRSLVEEQGRQVVLTWVREELDRARASLQSAENVPDRTALTDAVVELIVRRSEQVHRTRIGRVINATGVILHTGLGRAPLSQPAQAALTELAEAGNLEVDLESGDRRYRGYQLLSAWQTLTGAEDALVVNNNAAATLLTLQGLCSGKEVLISRGQLIEIGGSFRLPDIFQLSGAVLREVGTTNRTRLSDYERAIGPETAAIMHVHPSNYRVVGFSATPGIEDLAPLAHKYSLIAINDIGSGALVDVTRYGLPEEPTFQHGIAHGADVVLGSGDKLLGGPQCGIILGRSALIAQLRQHPLARTVRVGKLTLAALSATLDSYLRDAAEPEVPVVSMLAASLDSLIQRARNIVEDVAPGQQLQIEVQTATSPVGGGSLPTAELPTAVLALSHADYSPEELSRHLRTGSIRLFGRVQSDRVILDLRSVQPADDSRVALALRLLAGHVTG